MEVSYTVGIVGKLWPFYRNYRVKKHSIETQIRGVTIKPRLVLTLVDDSTVVIGAIEYRTWKVYPDFIDAVEKVREQKWAEELATQKNLGDNGTSLSEPLPQEQASSPVPQPTPSMLQ